MVKSIVLPVPAIDRVHKKWGQAGAAGVELPKQKNVSSGQLELEQKFKLVSGVCIGML